MADAICRMCGEPIDVYEFHDFAKQWNVSWQDVFNLFKKHGCGLVDAGFDGAPISEIGECRFQDDKVLSDDELAKVEAVYGHTTWGDDAVSMLQDLGVS